MAAIAGGTQNAIYANGLFNTTFGVEVSPIDVGTQSSRNGAFSLTYQWIGYYRPASSSAIQLGAACSYQEFYQFTTPPGPEEPFNWGGGGNSTCYIWTGATAISGFNTGNFTAFIQNGTSGANFTAAVGTYVPIRVQWSTVLPYEFINNQGTFSDYVQFAKSSFSFTIAGTSSISGRIFYNSLTNGF
jgi:hypothetical protein